MAVRDLAEGQCGFSGVAFVPKIVEAVNEKCGSDVRFFLSPKGINRLGAASGSI